MIDFSLMQLIQIPWEAGMHRGCKIGISHTFFQVTCLSSMEMPHQIAIILALWETAPPVTPTLTLFSWRSQPLAKKLPPEWVSWLWPGLFSCSTPEFCAFSFCFNAYTVTNSLSGISSSWIVFDREIYFPSRFTFSLDNSNPSMQSGIWHCSENCLVSF